MLYYTPWLNPFLVLAVRQVLKAVASSRVRSQREDIAATCVQYIRGNQRARKISETHRNSGIRYVVSQYIELQTLDVAGIFLKSKAKIGLQVAG